MENDKIKVSVPLVDGAVGYNAYRIGKAAFPLPRKWWERLLRRPVQYRYEDVFMKITALNAYGEPIATESPTAAMGDSNA